MPAARRRKSKGAGTRDDVTTSEDTPPESKDSDTPDDSELTNDRDANDDDDDNDGRRRRRRRSARLLQLYAPRLPVMSSTFVVMLFALLAPLADRAYHKLHTEGRLASDVASVTHRVGRFHVKWDIHNLRLSVRAPVHPTDVVSPTRTTPNQGKPLTVFSAPSLLNLTSPSRPWILLPFPLRFCTRDWAGASTTASTSRGPPSPASRSSPPRTGRCGSINSWPGTIA